MLNASMQANESMSGKSSECMLPDNSAILPPLYNLYYFFKPAIPRRAQLWLRRQLALKKLKRVGNIWPVNESAGVRIGWPSGLNWPGWPENKHFALVLNHDVDTLAGHDKCRHLMDLEENMGVRSTFFFVPERYPISQTLLEEVKARGFGLGVHGLKHDGKLFSTKETFCKSAKRINGYLKQWGTKGFSAPSMIRNHEWMQQLDIDYCTSTFDTDPFEPQSDGIGTIFPLAVNYSAAQHQQSHFFIELPYTLPQDHCLFILLKEKDISIWERKLDWIAGKRGMALLNSHPDYMYFGGHGCALEEYDHTKYKAFLEYTKSRYQGQYWHALTEDMAKFWIKIIGVGTHHAAKVYNCRTAKRSTVALTGI